ncbi:MAG: hypothetical protein WBB42_06520 [Polyangiales bacterium]
MTSTLRSILIAALVSLLIACSGSTSTQGTAEALIEPYEATCGPDVLPIEEANRLQNLYVVSFFKSQLRNERGYDRFLTPAFAETEPGVAVTVK